jgi:acetyl-CoA carboxylase carboxyl transferase subunit beta
MRDLLRHAHRDGRAPEGTDRPDELWVRCPRCKELQYRAEHEQLLKVCGKCKYHFRLSAPERIAVTVDPDSFRERDAEIQPVDPLGFTAGDRTYREKLEESAETTGISEGFIYGVGSVDDLLAVVGAIDMDFIGGSMGAVVGEKVTRAMELALEENLPLVLFSSSGGARMQEGVIALMQLAKVLTRIDDMAARAVPFVSVMADPCYGGVTASYAMLGDVNIGEPGAFIGFAGPRVIEQTTRARLPPGAAQAEFLLQHGMLDLVVPRSEMRNTLSRLLRMYSTARAAPSEPARDRKQSVKRERDELRVGV